MLIIFDQNLFLKDRVIVQLWTLTNQNAPNWSDPEFIQWANFANNGMNAVIRYLDK